MYIIIAGCRKVGSNLAKMLAQENHDVVVIDSDPANFDLLGTGFNGMTITGMPIDEDVLRSAGIEKADSLAAVSNDDNMNVMISQVSRNIFHVPRVITRVYDPEREKVFNKMGLQTISPTLLAVEKIKNFLITSQWIEGHCIYGTEINFMCVDASKNQIGSRLSDIEDKTVLGIIRNQILVLAHPDLVIGEHDQLMVAEYFYRDDY